MFTVSVRNENSVTTVLPEGRLDTVNSTLFSEELKNHLEREDFLIIDFAGCNYLSSSGIRTLMAATKILKAKGGMLFITGMVPELLQVIEMTGLNKVFPHFKTGTEARNEILRLREDKMADSRIQIGDSLFHYRQLEKQEPVTFIWDEYGIAGFDELGVSFGLGSPAESLEEDENTRGLFVTIGNCCGNIPLNDEVLPDFRVVHHPAGGGVFVTRAVSFGMNPSRMVRLLRPYVIPAGRLADSVTEVALQSGADNLKAMVIADFNKPNPSVSLLYLQPEATSVTSLPTVMERYTITTEKGVSLLGVKFLLNTMPSVSPEVSFADFMKGVLTIENIESIVSADPADELVAPAVWLFTSDGWKNADIKRIGIEKAGDFVFEPYKAFLARRLYHDSARLVIYPLHGGYSAQTFQVDSFDTAGRKLRPTVLKISSRALINREADRCRRFALPYIMNNSAIILGTEFYGDSGALRYNFVGIGGEQTRLKWLTHYFNEWPVEQLEPLFDKIFTDILKPWYGQTVRELIYPFREHDPTWTFFPQLCETAHDILGISAEDPRYTIPETGQELVNPYWFLKNEFKKRRNISVDYPTAVCHGDLNMQNILLDNELNVYLIDFSETRPRAAISDFARLEAIFMVERAPMENSDDLKQMIEFVTRFYRISSLEDLPGNDWKGANREIMKRNIAMALKMRQYSTGCVAGDFDMAPYCLAMLEWVLPIVCYGGVPVVHKKLSACVAALLCEKIMQSDRFGCQ